MEVSAKEGLQIIPNTTPDMVVIDCSHDDDTPVDDTPWDEKLVRRIPIVAWLIKWEPNEFVDGKIYFCPPEAVTMEGVERDRPIWNCRTGDWYASRSLGTDWESLVDYLKKDLKLWREEFPF